MGTHMPWQLTIHMNKHFMTASELRIEHAINPSDLPKGSRSHHGNWKQQMDKIDIKDKNKYETIRDLIRSKFQGKKRVEIIIGGKQKKKDKELKRVLEIHRDEFAKEAIASLKKSASADDYD